MKCIFCQCEMEKGVFSAININNVSAPITQRYTSEEELQKKGIKAALFRKSKYLKKNGEAWYCEHCQKVIGIFDIRK